MINLNKLVENDTNTIKMYHGGKKWYYKPRDVQSSAKNRYEHGVGIYTTNFYNTAYRYAKGSRVLHLVYIDKNFTDIKDVTISKEEAIEFIKNTRFNNKSKFLDDVIGYFEQKSTEEIPLNVINNLMIDNESGVGKGGIAMTQFFIKHGGDATYVSQSGSEYWIIIFNPEIINRFEVVNPKNMGEPPFDFELQNSI